MLDKSIIFCLLAVSFGQIHNFGRCPTPSRGRVDLDRYSGKWYEYQRSCNIWDNATKCIRAYWDKPEGGISKVLSTSISLIKNGVNSSLAAEAANNDHNLGMNYHSPNLGPRYYEYWILDTDYDNYAISWSCENNELTRTEYSYIFTRNDIPAVDVEKIAREVFARESFEMPYMATIDQQNCP